MRNNKKLNQSRRKFLGQSGKLPLLALSGPALEVLINSMVAGMFNRAHAKSQKIKNLVAIQFPGAPPRWMFDLLLTPYAGDHKQMISNGSVATAYSGSSPTSNYKKTIYKTHKYKSSNGTIFLPHMWKFSLPVSRGAQPMTNLAENMMIIRGFNMQINGHGANRDKMFAPSSGGPSIGGHLADNSQRFIPGVHANIAAPFHSRKGLKPNRASTRTNRNAVDHVLSNLKPSTSTKIANLKQSYGSAMEAALGKFNQHSQARDRRLSSVAHNRASAEILFRKGFRDVDEFWGEAQGRYQSIASKALFSAGLTGINDRAIENLGGEKIFNTDIGNQDIRSIIQVETMIPHIADLFALTEYMLTYELTNYISFPLYSFRNLMNNNGSLFVSDHDLHTGSTQTVTYLYTMYWRVVASCLLELIESLKAKSSTEHSGSLFDNTTLQLMSEFNRSPRDNKTGADHGWQANSVSLFSGVFKGPQIIGNIQKGPTSGSYKGTWGQAAPTELLNGDKIEIRTSHYGETMATLLGAPGLIDNGISLVDLNGNTLAKKASIVG